MEQRFVKSGIPGLDSILGGGFLEGSVVTVSGPTGSGKSTLAAQFIHSGAMEGEPGMYICLEENRRDFFFHNSGFNWDFMSLEKDRKFILLDYPIHEVDQIVSQAAAISEIISSTGTKRVVIDSIMPIALFF
ncbi:MAG TPA: ATPase domain-containing protein, partial [Candidatus Bilamarchaeum sp.]|nr:ATPase domain-containing protein [Candidatus Bilamarchaeum sp.]